MVVDIRYRNSLGKNHRADDDEVAVVAEGSLQGNPVEGSLRTVEVEVVVEGKQIRTLTE